MFDVTPDALRDVAEQSRPPIEAGPAGCALNHTRGYYEIRSTVPN
jgi:hypothetical protein